MAVNERKETCCDKFASSSGLCCFMNMDEYKYNTLAEVVQNSERRCTDLPCCLILILAFLSEIALVWYANNNGAQPKLLMHGYDSRQFDGITEPQICDNDNINGQYAIWPDTEYSDIRICETSCSQTNNQNNSWMIDYYSSSSFMDAYCLSDISDDLPSGFDSSSGSFERAISDLQTAAYLILIMSIVSIIISYLYLRIISLVGRLLIIFTIITVLIGGIMISVLLIQDGKRRIDDPQTKDIGEIELGVGILFSVILFFLVLALWFMRKNIELVIEMLNEASYAIRDMKLTLVFPIFISIIGMIYIGFWVVEALFIYSVKTLQFKDYPSSFDANGNYVDIGQYYYYEFNDAMQDALIWHFVMLFYISQVIIYYGFMVLAGVFADWYFSLWSDKNNKIKKRGDQHSELSSSPICESLWRVTRYHLGSLAFGALIITLIRIIRAIVTYIQKKVESKAGNNILVKCIFCCVECCLRCCQCIFDKINKEGFIFTTIYGTSYCYSSFTALSLLTSNIGRTVMIEGVSSYTELFGRIAISSLCTGFAILAMKYNNYYSNNLSSFLFPSCIIFVISYIIASLFMMVFEVAVETIFLCFLVDEEVHDGQAKYANHGLTQLASFASKSSIIEENSSQYGSSYHNKNNHKSKSIDDNDMDYAAV